MSLRASWLSWSALLLAAACGLAPGCVTEEDAERAARERCEEVSSDLFQRRIAPLLTADRPKSCNECHLRGIDLSLFVRDSACESIACLVQLGLADPDDPERSVVLDWIRRAEPRGELLTERVLTEEYEGFRAWLTESLTCEGGACARARCREQRSPGSCDVKAALDSAPQIPEDCSDAELELLFREKIFSARGRCFPCHHEGQAADVDAPRFFATAGGCDLASLTTLRTMERSGYFDLDDPTQSLLLLKPLAESAGGVEHGGHTKFGSTSDPGYVAFLAFIERASACRAQREGRQGDGGGTAGSGE